MLHPLSEIQKAEIKSRAIYWKEVRGRDDKSPISDEHREMQKKYGHLLLYLLEFCAEN